ncbi:MAG: LysM peptidoglycan-binding domain-containing protein [Prosthecobacter sp.]
MKPLPTDSCVLKHLMVFCGTILTASAQVSHTYTAPPPPGYPASSGSSRKSAAAIQAPAYNPAAYPPPPGYGTYAPPRVTTPPKTTAKPATSSKTSSKPTTSSKKSSAGPPPPPAKVYGPSGDITSQVAKLQESDKIQNSRLGELERDVSSIKRGSKSSGSSYNGGTDLAAHTTYVARPGDTLWRIATTHRVSVGEIQQLNRMVGEEVLVGQTLLIPSPHRLASTTAPTSYKPSTPGGSVPSSSSSSSYTVKKGDSLKAIAIRYKMTTNALASANRIKDPNKIYVGQRLKIPGSSRSSQSVAASSSDTVPLPGFGIGQTTQPPGTASLAPPPMPAPAPPPPSSPATASVADSHRGILAYRVDRSDTIESIATQFSTTPERIREINRLGPQTALKPNDEIMVPAMGAVSVNR